MIKICSTVNTRDFSLEKFKIITRASVYGEARVIKCNRFPRQKGCHSPRRSMRRPRKLGTRTRHCSLVTDLGVLVRKPWQASRLVRSSRIHRCRSFSERVGPRVIVSKASQVSSCSKRSREITTLTESIAVLTKIDSQ